MYFISSFLLIMSFLSTRLVRSHYFQKRTSLMMASKSFVRPTLDDVERISRGDAAKRRGTGSRAVPHRLNLAERKEWDLAKKRKYLLLRGTGWRKERGDSPLHNIYRQYCDATNIICITVARGIGNSPDDEVTIDFSPLRSNDLQIIIDDLNILAKNVPSFLSTINTSENSQLFWGESFVEMLAVEPIWRIPAMSIKILFSDRAGSRSFAEAVAIKYAGSSGDSNANVSDNLDDDDDLL